jgi:UDP-N-acetylmuramoyl-tripeptide--D-alanyl-D-alanine ligase
VIPLPLELVRPLGRLETAAGATVIAGVQIDSRRIEPGDLFVAVGRGADFADAALSRGAAGVLVPDDAFAALGALGRAVRARTSARVVGITGSSGKTSTKDILAALCAPHARTVANEGNFNQELGVPLTLARIEPDTEICISEMGMRGLGQVAYLAAIARPHVAVITNVGPAHLELVETIENVARAKAELVDALPPGGIAIVPDDPILEPFLLRGDVDVRRFAAVEESGVFRIGDRSVRMRTNLAAAYHQQNLLAALLAADALGIEVEDGELEVELSRLRGEEVPLPGGGVLINDAYNANPASLRAALQDLVVRAAGRRSVAVIGEMAELGAEAARYHREAGAAARELGVDLVVSVGGPLAREYAADEHASTLEDGAVLVRRLLEPGDVVLVKASRAVGLERLADALAGAAVS